MVWRGTEEFPRHGIVRVVASAALAVFRFRVARNLIGWPGRVRKCQGYRAMKARETTLKLKRFEADEKARKVRDLEQMVREFEQMAVDLDRQIKAEEERTGVKDAGHFAYSTFAKSAQQRRQNLLTSIESLRAKYEAAIKDRDDAQAEAIRGTGSEAREFDRSRRRGERPSAEIR